MNKQREEVERRIFKMKEAKINELLQQQEYLKSEIEAKHHIVRNQFKLLNIKKKLGRVRER